MHITVDRDDLKAATDSLHKMVETRTTVPVLHQVILDGREAGRLRVRGNNLDQDVTVEIGARTFEPGITTFPFVRLRSFVDAVETLSMTIRAEGTASFVGVGGVTLWSDDARQYWEDYPSLSIPDGDFQTVHMDRKALLSALRATRRAMGTEETRYYLNGVYVEPAEEGISITATDGHRLVRAHAPVANDGVFPTSLIVPARAAQWLRRQCEMAAHVDRVEIGAHGGAFFFARVGDARMTSKSIDGPYPDTQRYTGATLPDDVKVVTFAAQELRLALLAALGAPTAMLQEISLSAEADRLTAVLRENDVRVGEISVPCTGTLSDSIGMNAWYLVAALEHLSGDITMKVSSGGDPVFFTGASDEAVRVIMPLRT